MAVGEGKGALAVQSVRARAGCPCRCLPPSAPTAGAERQLAWAQAGPVNVDKLIQKAYIGVLGAAVLGSLFCESCPCMTAD
jgi:hypothetical protein